MSNPKNTPDDDVEATIAALKGDVDYCSECDKVVDRPIIGWFSDEDAERMKAIQVSGQGMTSC